LNVGSGIDLRKAWPDIVLDAADISASARESAVLEASAAGKGNDQDHE
jgi:hypothetical protein